jgi:hypothetical protein
MIGVSKCNWIKNEEFRDAYEKMREAFSITVPEFRRLLASFGLRFNWLSDLDYFLPAAIGDTVKFDMNAQDKYVGYDRNGKILLGSVTEPGFYRVNSIPRRKPTFNHVFVRKETYDLFPEMTYSDARKVFDRYGMRHCMVEGTCVLAWKQGLNLVCAGTYREEEKSFSEFRVIVPSLSECAMVGFDGKDSNDYHYNLMRTVRDAFLQTLLEEAAKERDRKLTGFIPLPESVDIKSLPEGLLEVMAETLNLRAARERNQ